MKQKNFYVMLVIGDCEPEIHGPYKTSKDRDGVAVDLAREYGTGSSYFPLDMDYESYEGSEPSITIDTYTGEELELED